VERIWENKKVVIFDVDVQGGIALKKYFQEKALSIFIMPPSVAALELRLIARGTDDLETIHTRVAKATEEISYKNEFDEIVVNDHLEDSQIEIEKLIENFLQK
jgi:guanylate kinase